MKIVGKCIILTKNTQNFQICLDFGYPRVIDLRVGSGRVMLNPKKSGFGYCGYPKIVAGRVGFSGNRVPDPALVNITKFLLLRLFNKNYVSTTFHL